MVKQGFLNLSQQEQKQVLEAALDEFSKRDFKTASLNSIIEQAGISKGSMYHYFHNKEDLYLYLMEIIMVEKSRFLAAALQDLKRPVQELSMFETLTLQLNTAVQFARENPRYHLINKQLQDMPDGALKQKIWGRFTVEFDKYMNSMITNAIKNGELRSDLDRKFITRVLRFVMLNFTDFYPDYNELLQMDEEELQQEVGQIIDFLQNGLAAPGNKEEKQ
ncbi:transcriptional regulator, TetR family [Dethiobacter alkaliphilus AHT 1]|uniref:Transcriptional regulator, TetR family n=1 Tax=Dethiobacter alkaliphilus AHT 1 TaxID=555088 RepID=C0GIH9_DETAL|nr:transcriptional regulator, TetR family [Dethiobacter alkaliphilus AHT 1]